MKTSVVIVGGVPATVLFVVVLGAYVVQSQLTQYVQSDLAYRQPYLIFYIAHSSFSVIFPLHLLYLTITTGKPARAYLRGLRDALSLQFSSYTNASPSAIHAGPGSIRSYPPISPSLSLPSLVPESLHKFPIRTLLRAVLLLTGGATVPSLLWYVSVSLAPISDVTAIFNTHAFWAYVLTVVITRAKWEKSKLAAVLLACIGVFVVVYGGRNPSVSLPGSGADPGARLRDDRLQGSGGHAGAPAAVPASASALVGDAITLTAAFMAALWEVLYKKYIALDATEGDVEAPYEALQTSDALPAPAPPRHTYTPIPDSSSGSHPDRSTNLAQSESANSTESIDSIPPPFGFHANFFTSGIGVGTLLLLWLPLWLAHSTGVYKVALPPDARILAYVLGIATAGLVYNAGFMILLGVWGPVIASVGNLLTIVLVMISDIIVSGAANAVTPGSILGSFMIVGAFSVLVVDILGRRQPERRPSS